jgi:hypothetical protein
MNRKQAQNTEALSCAGGVLALAQCRMPLKRGFGGTTLPEQWETSYLSQPTATSVMHRRLEFAMTASLTQTPFATRSSSCAVVGCDGGHLLARERLQARRLAEHDHSGTAKELAETNPTGDGWRRLSAYPTNCMRQLAKTSEE